MKAVDIYSGDSAIILAQPHSGTFVPDDIYTDLNDLGRQLIDTDWHMPTLYDGLLPGASVVRANFSRYVIDPNRDPEGNSLYPNQNTTALVPLSTFDGDAIWKKPPSTDQIRQRIDTYHRTYHKALEGEIARVKSVHGFAVLFDCHSIRSNIPYLFDKQLPDLNVGDNGGGSCSALLTAIVEGVCKQLEEFSYVINGRFRGGWTTRHYGRASESVHAIQMELSQRTYLVSETPPFNYDLSKALAVRKVLARILYAINSVNLVTQK